ncbi:MAG: deoxynucleoside kinase [Bacteroidetes bacterium]|nr:deoxynucleoside kinase [Bacteroidota bacterium]
MYNYIAISGTIGAGKTELASRISASENCNLILEEFAANTFLKKFYQKPERYAFPLEISFLFERFQQLKTVLSNADIFSSVFISDYFFDKSLIFAKNNLTYDQFSVFYPLFEAFREQMPFPDLLIYLHRPVEELLENIKIRGRKFEKKIQYEYLDGLQNAYLSYFKSLTEKRILILELHDVDFVRDDKIFQKILELTRRKHPFGMKIVSF